MAGLDEAPGGSLPELPDEGGLSERPLIVQSDGTLLLEVSSPVAAAARDALCCFAQLERSPEYMHTYRISALSLWNAAAAGVPLPWIERVLKRFSRYPVPELVSRDLREQFSRFGRTRLKRWDGRYLLLEVEDPAVRLELERLPELAPLWAGEAGEGLLVAAEARGALKKALVRHGWPAEDLCGYSAGEPLELRLLETTRSGEPFSLRQYQREAAAAFHAGGGPRGGAGVVVLPCGAGKTIVGLAAMECVKMSTLILSTNTVAVHQWRDEILDRTGLDATQIGEYTGQRKEVRPVTIATYQMLTYRESREGPFEHLELLRRAQWGLIIYDEVHMLPAPVFRATAEIQVRRRLGLTATLVREDGREDDVFALIGPKRYEVPWKVLEHKGYIAQATCCEVRVAMSESLRMEHALAPRRDRFRLAAENPKKVHLVEELIENNPDDQILVIGQYVAQLEEVAGHLKLPLITGKTPTRERERLYDEFRSGRLRVLVVSKVANFAIDLPDASLAIQISGTFGSRQEEAQRLGRILRPKTRAARFYSIVSRDSAEQEFAAKRQLFLVEQGYRYRIVDWGA
ncbi:MAG: helicase-associated domain-containing protein [Candidatus Wallbacteria bacterium]|nr:helicase-associated domain-containing protein [Candidatus Wallbacteria bacterium]